MSRRYGRAQKAKHRSEIAALRKANENFGHVNKRRDATINELQKNLDRVRDIIQEYCRNSIAIPAEGRLIDGEIMDTYRLSNHTTLAFNTPICSDMVTYRTIDLYKLEVFCERHAERFSTSVHLVLSNGRHSAYMISDQGLLDTPDHVLAEYLIPKIAMELSKHIKKVGRP